MKTKKVLNYRNVSQMSIKNIQLAIFVEMLQDFGVVKENDITFYCSLVNLHYDLNLKSQNRIKNNENRPI